MRVVFETPHMTIKNKLPNGEVAEGPAYLSAILYDEGEPTTPAGPQGQPSGRLVSDWLSAVRPGQAALRVPPDASFVGMPDAVIPASVIHGLPRKRSPATRLEVDPQGSLER